MTTFWIIGGLFVVAALLFVVPPLLARRGGGGVSRSGINAAIYRDQLRELEADVRAGTLSAEHYEKARREIELRLLEDTSEADASVADTSRRGRLTAVVVGLAVPLVAIGLYLVVGNPQGLTPERTATGDQAPHSLDLQQVQAMVEKLAARLQAQPDDAEGWVMLARSYNAMGRFQEAATAYANAVARLPANAQLLADYADTLAMAQGRRLAGEPENLIKRALQADPDNVKALALAGTVAFEKKDYVEAAAQWEKIMRLVPPESDIARSVSSSIAEARSLGKGAGVASSTLPAETGAPAAGGGARVSGVVRLAPTLASRAAPTDTVFIFARAPSGPRMPLAIVRKQVRELPVKFVLDDTMAMAPGMRLSDFPQVVIGARISKSANATPQAGDLEGRSGPVKVGSAGIAVVIDSIVP